MWFLHDEFLALLSNMSIYQNSVKKHLLLHDAVSMEEEGTWRRPLKCLVLHRTWVSQ
jgi:hypothetical protein